MAAGAFEVFFTRGAEQDLASIYDYIAEFDCKANADHVLDRLLEIIAMLAFGLWLGPFGFDSIRV
jgi:toxin ParE1/3/4